MRFLSCCSSHSRLTLTKLLLELNIPHIPLTFVNLWALVGAVDQGVFHCWISTTLKMITQFLIYWWSLRFLSMKIIRWFAGHITTIQCVSLIFKNIFIFRCAPVVYFAWVWYWVWGLCRLLTEALVMSNFIDFRWINLSVLCKLFVYWLCSSPLFSRTWSLVMVWHVNTWGCVSHFAQQIDLGRFVIGSTLLKLTHLSSCGLGVKRNN